MKVIKMFKEVSIFNSRRFGLITLKIAIRLFLYIENTTLIEYQRISVLILYR
jgi:hypothetical protein